MTNLLVTDFGAIPDGKTPSSPGIQAAIDQQAANGGGRVVVPPGTYLCGTIELKSHVELHLESGAVILGAPELDAYTEKTWGFHKDRTPWHLIFAKGAEDIALTGRGTIDGNGPAFWQSERPSEWHFWREKHLRPTPLVEIQDCRDVLLEGIRVTNPPGWTVHLFDCDQTRVTGIRIETDLFGPNSDGIDVTGCHDLIISDCYIRAGDDAIALKTYRDSKDERGCERVAITNCILETNCAAIRLGFESCYDYRDVVVSNCVVKRASRAIDLRMIEGGTLENVRIEGITGTTNCGWPMNRPIELTATSVPNALTMFEGHPNWGREVPPTGQSAIRNVTLRDIDLETDGRVILAAAPGHEIRDIFMDNIRLRYPMIDDPEGFNPQADWNGDSGFLPGMPELARVRAALVAKNIAELEVSRFRVEWPKGPVPERWMLLESAHRKMNPAYVERNDTMRAGELNPPFQAAWLDGCKEARLDASRLTGFAGAEVVTRG